MPGASKPSNDLSIDFAEGQLTSLLGPSGCGKTTLLKIIAGLIPASGGEVKVDGRVVTGPGPERAFVFQDFALMPWASVMRNVAFGLELKGMARSEREAIAEKYIASVGLKGFERSLSARVVRRHAPARRAGPGTRRQCQGAADGRALLGG